MKTIETWFLWLMIYSVIGWIYESTICSIGQRKLINRGFLNGPYCPIYGTGAVLVLLVLGRIQNPVLLFFAGAVLTCSLEYLTSWLMEKLFHARWWDYSKRKFNIGGRVCLIGAVVFGAFSVVLILVCTSMCAWWIVRVNNWAAKLLYTLFLFNMIVPFQMVMFTLSKIADMLKLNTPWGLCIVYLGFGAGLAVFIFTGVIKGIPQELEESAMIDGASVPRIFFQIVVPIMKPSIVSVSILEAMWIWNDYLLPYLTLDLGKYKTISVAVQYLKGGYGSVDMGAMMACLVLAIIPIIVFYLVCQKYIVSGVMAGAVKG